MYGDVNGRISVLDKAIPYYEYGDDLNTDIVSNRILLSLHVESWEKDYLKGVQNSDGGFGLAKNSTSEIIGTKLALRALADLDETEAMTKAAIYIASLQNADGGVFDDPMATGYFFSTGVQNLT